MAMPPTAAEFRKLMGRFATGVCVVSVKGGEHGVAAMTINSFVSVSLDPLLVCWSLHNSSSQFELFSKSERFAVSILARDQGESALRYAARGDTMLDPDDFEESGGGLPVVRGAIGHFECEHHAIHLAGDHTMILGKVAGLGPTNSDLGEASPLAFFGGKFCSIGQ